jgi:hypothetical protein
MRLATPIAIAAAVLGFAVAHAEVASWKIIDGHSDPLTDKPSRFAVAMAKSTPAFRGQPVTTALVIRCVTIFTNKPAEPEVMLLFTGLTELGRVRNVVAHYRWDEGPVRDYTLKTAGARGTRAIELPKFTSPTKLVEGEDPIADIVAAKRFRAEVQFASQGTIVLDINVAGANDAIHALACH